MVWSSASSTLIGPFVVAFVFRSSPNTHPLRSVGAFGNALYPLRLSVSGSSPLRGRRGAHPYVAPCEFERYSPKCVEKLSDNSRRASFRSSRRGATRPEALFERRSCHPGQLPEGAKANYQTVSRETVWKLRFCSNGGFTRSRNEDERSQFGTLQLAKDVPSDTSSDFPDSL